MGDSLGLVRKMSEEEFKLRAIFDASEAIFHRYPRGYIKHMIVRGVYDGGYLNIPWSRSICGAKVISDSYFMTLPKKHISDEEIHFCRRCEKVLNNIIDNYRRIDVRTSI